MPVKIPNTINFFRAQRRQLEKLHKFDVMALRIAGGVCAAAVVVLVALLAYWQYQRLRLSEIQEKTEVQQRIILEAQEDEKSYRHYLERLELLAAVFESRNSKKEALDFLSTIALPSVAFDRIQYDDRSRILTFQIEADNVFSVEQFLETLRSPVIANQVSKVDVSSIRRDENARYIMEVSVTLFSQQQEEDSV